MQQIVYSGKKMGQFLEKYNQLRLNCEEIKKKLEIAVSNEIKALINNLTIKKSPRLDGINRYFYPNKRRINTLLS
jgi:hypothetical protein